MNLAFRWFKRNSCFLLLACVTALAMGGCPPTAPPGDDPPPGQNTINVVISPAGSGTVEQDADGDMVTLTATGNEGFMFDGWSGVQLQDPDENPLTVDATQVGTITANFIEGTEPPRPINSCGDGVVDRTEQCDDSNTASGDGCSSTCRLETAGECGDGEVNGSEECDDGEETSACNSDCTASRCGDDVLNVHSGEQCDDGNTVSGDDCSSTCHDEIPPPAGCGDGVVNGTEECDGDGESATCNANCTNSRCGDGIVNTSGSEQCDDRNTTNGDGCSSTCQLEGPPPPPPPPPPPQNCGNGTINGEEECDTSGESATCNSNCTLSQCGDNILNATAGEQCDDGGTTSGDGCSSTCRSESSTNDSCNSPTPVTDGTRAYNNIGATTDGPDEPTACRFFDFSNVSSDVWYCYTASCTGTAFVSLCGSDYDTKLAAYTGCGCPTSAPLACSDDDCGSGVENVQSRVEFSVTQGSQYMIRVGAFLDDQGDGRLTIGCNVDACASGAGNCFTPLASSGCGDPPGCCADTCAVDQFCCDVTWDERCAGEAEGLCTAGFPTCAPGAGSCGIPDATPGCEDNACCNRVCRDDPFCCLADGTWDPQCVDEAEAKCFLTCGRTAGGCSATHASPGCDNVACCELVCAEDGKCCSEAWDQLCVNRAAQLCP